MIAETDLHALTVPFPALRTLDAALLRQVAMELHPAEQLRAVETMFVGAEPGCVLATSSRLLAFYNTVMVWKRFPTVQTFHYEHVSKVQLRGAETYVYGSPHPAGSPDEYEENTFRFANELTAQNFAGYLAQHCPRLRATQTPAAPHPVPASVAPSPPVHASQAHAPAMALDDVIRSHVGPLRSSRIHLAEDLPPKKREHARQILAGVTQEAPVAFFDLTLWGGGANAVILTSTMLVAREDEERVALPLGQMASPTIASDLHDRLAVQVGQIRVSFPCGSHDEVLIRVLGALAYVAHQRRGAS
jgi:hypothetical protein